MITIQEAIEIILSLARQNIAPEEMEQEHARQIEACNVLEDFAVNHLGDE